MIQLYWKNATAEVVGEHGVSPAELAAVAPKVIAAQKAVKVEAGGQDPHKALPGRDKGIGYFNLPTHPDYKRQVMEKVELYKGKITDLVVLGIGGSALGNVALQAALNPSTYNLLTDAKRPGPRLFVLDNVDPAMIDDVMSIISRRLNTTLFNVISKSGETAETASQFMLFREMLRKRLGEGEYAKHILATTDLKKGTLHDIALKEGYEMLPVPDDVGGRFSVLTPVGLFSAAMCGIDIQALLGGAAAMAQRCAGDDWETNPAALLAAVKYQLFTRGKVMHVMMPYSNRLDSLADWYRQLWAESLGKEHDLDGNATCFGATPIKALGATDQHSQVQLYREGPNDKLFVFLEVAKHAGDMMIPHAFPEVDGLAYLGKARLSKLLNSEKIATEYALARSLRPSVTLKFDAITPHSVGEFIYLYEYVTSLVGQMARINTYDQPAVELGKQATFALMGRPGYDEMAKKIRTFAKPDGKYLV
jgi:glucose-6-phosphate isomerase